MVTNNYFLIFNSHFDRDKGLDKGRLSICSIENGTLDIWVARSSHATKQYAESFHERGGYLPPEYRVPDITNWYVETKPIDLRKHKGVAGNFYKITPFEVTTDKGGKRGDFGIHLDANVPGSMGCIVLNKKRFAEFESWMKRLEQDKIPQISLFVRYS